MSKGGPWFEPLSGLVVYVCIPGAAPGTTLAEPTTTLCRALGADRAWEEAAPRRCGRFPSLFSTTSLGEAGTNSAARVRGILATAAPLWSARWLRAEASWAVSETSS